MKFLTNLFDIKKDNMIKKFLFGLIGAIWFVGFTSAYTTDFINWNTNIWKWHYWVPYWINYWVNTDIDFNSIELKVTENLDFFTNSFENVFIFIKYNGYSFSDADLNMFWWKNWNIYFIYADGCSITWDTIGCLWDTDFWSRYYEGFIDNWCITEDYNNCTFDKSIWDVKSSIDLSNLQYFTLESIDRSFPVYSDTSTRYCFYDWTKYYCFSCWWNNWRCDSSLTWNLSLLSSFPKYEYTPIRILSNSINWDSSPFSYWWNTIKYWSTGDIVSNDMSADDYIRYYEKYYNYNKSMCYAWIDNIDNIYWDSVSFDEGTGLTIMWVYRGIYNYDERDIKTLWKRLNGWLLNYRQWFIWWWYRSLDNIDWLARFRDENWDLYSNGNFQLIYTWFSFPFKNEPLALYFMTDNLVNSKYISDNAWEEIIHYCQLKLRDPVYWYDDINESWNKTDISKNIKDYVNSWVKTWNYVVPSSGSFIDSLYWEYDIPEDINPVDLFKDFFEKITSVFTSIWFWWNGILPYWIIYPLIVLVLFRFLSK